MMSCVDEVNVMKCSPLHRSDYYIHIKITHLYSAEYTDMVPYKPALVVGYVQGTVALCTG